MAARLPALAPLFASSIAPLGNERNPLSVLLARIQEIGNEAGSKKDIEYDLLVDANALITELDGEIIAVFKYLRDNYTKRFPELESFDLGPCEYAKTAKAVGREMDLTKVDLAPFLPPATVMVITVTATTTSGKPLTDAEQAVIEEAADAIISMDQHRRKFLEFIESRMESISPNVSAIVGTAIASQLVGAAGGILQLSRMPAGNIQVLGSTRRNLAGFSMLHVRPHSGHIYDCDLVAKTALDLRTKAQRLIAAKVAMAARLDSFRESMDGAMGRAYREDIVKKLDKLAEPAPMRPIKPLPPPDAAPKKKRGGKRARKLKEMYAVTELRKQQNRMTFGQAEDEAIVGSSVSGLGLIGANSGRVRAVTADPRLRETIKKQSQRAYSGMMTSASTIASSVNASTINATTFSSISGGGMPHRTPAGASTLAGTATSLAFTPVQGIELQNPELAKQRVREANERYFSASGGFRKVTK